MKRLMTTLSTWFVITAAGVLLEAPANALPHVRTRALALSDLEAVRD